MVRAARDASRFGAKRRAPQRDGSAQPAIVTDIPARLDRLPWSRFHVLVVVALGITWILDGLEVTIVGAIGPVLQSPLTLGLTAGEIGGAASAYVTGAVIGALIFGWMTDRFGRRVIFYATLIVYLVGVLLTATSWSFWSFALFRAITGFGIGGEYAAINSAIDELMPARYRGRIDIIINGSFWVGAVAGSGASLIFLNPNVFAPNVGWRLAFAVGGVLCLGILLMRRHVGEPALARDPRLCPPSRRDGRRHRAARARGYRAGARARAGPARSASAPHLRLRSDRARDARQVSQPQHADARADDRTGVFVQRGLLLLCLGAGALSWGCQRAHRNASGHARSEQFPRAAPARAFLRHNRPGGP